jgi:succinyl-diaminopimelate desuccinylase
MRKAQIDSNRLFGRGARDMLFATASYLAFIHRNQEALSEMNVGILLSGDEEVGGINTIPIALERGITADVVVLPDAGNNLSELVMQAKGVFNFDLVAYGAAHHGSRPWEGEAATHKLIELLTELRASFPEASNEATTVTVAQLDAGDSINKGPATARAHLDIRYTNENDLRKYQQLINQLCEKYNAKLCNIVIEPNYSVDMNSSYIQRYIEINKHITGKEVKQVSVSGSSDARYFTQKNMPVIMTRPVSAGSHSDNEWVDLDSLDMFYKIMQTYVLEVATIR